MKYLGTKGIYPFVWLRDCSHDSKTYNITDSIKARIPFMRDFDVKIKPLAIQYDLNSNSLVINWPGHITS